jgi:hypothetical protein
MGIEKIAATKLPGRNRMVTTARVFMDEESCCEDMAMKWLSRATWRERRPSLWEIVLKSYVLWRLASCW